MTEQLGSFNINHFWSLQVEEQFYFLWPFIVYRLRRPAALVKVAVAGCSVALVIRIALVTLRGHPHFNNEYLVYTPTFSCFDNLLFGCGLSALLRSSKRRVILRRAPTVLLAGLALLFAIFIYNHGLGWRRSGLVCTLGFSLMGLSSAALVAAALRPASVLERVFSTRLLRFFGKYSYGLYVYHYSISSKLLPIRAVLQHHLHSKAAGVVIVALLAGSLSILTAVLGYHLFEAKFLRLKRFFSYDFQKHPRQSVDAVTN